jgi:uncharacterized protein YeaO (DUF488 family)
VTLIVRTARISSTRPDRLDVTRKGRDPLGIVFAPSDALLWPYIAKRKATGLTAADWMEYSKRYREEMRASYQRHRDGWNTLLACDTVTLVCFCTDSNQCHRRLLAEILATLGASDAGEEVPAP